MKKIYTMAFTGLLLFFVTCAVAQTPLQCGVNDSYLPDSTIRLMSQLPQLMATQKARKAAGERNVCRLAIEIDSDTYLALEKDTNRIRSYVLSQIDKASETYEREINTKLVVVYIHIWKDTEPDPYRGITSMYTSLDRFSSYWTSNFRDIPYDKRLYLVRKNIGNIAGVGQLGGVSGVSVFYEGTIRHELGHMFGSPHTHNCLWPGGPIDYCSTIEGSCYSGSLQNGKGTLMSYCGYGDYPLAFHPLCQALISDHAVKNLAKLTIPDRAPTLPAQLMLTGTPFLYWNGQPLAERYDIEVAEDNSFTKLVVSDTARVNGYLLDKLLLGQTYFTRIRTVNRFGNSDWSSIAQLQVNGIDGIPAPKLLFPNSYQFLQNWNRKLQAQAIDKATSYEIQVARALEISSDELFESPTYKDVRSEPSFTSNFVLLGPYWWRVRAIVGDKKGPWSSLGRFIVNGWNELYLPFTNNSTLSFPYSYSPLSKRSLVQVTLANDSLFTKPTFLQTFQYNERYIGMLDKLLTNKQYYLKLEEVNTQSAQYPMGTVSYDVKAFKVGSVPLSRWSFLNYVTNSKLPTENLFSELVSRDKAVWITTLNGLTRIQQDSLTLRVYDRTSTNGKIGNQDARLSRDNSGGIWLMNQISALSPTNPKLTGPFYQVVKVSDSGEVSERTTFAANGNYISGFTGNPRLFYSTNIIYEQKGDSLAVLYRFPSDRFIIDKVTQSGMLWLCMYNSSTSTHEVVQLNTSTRAIQTFTTNNTPQLGQSINSIEIDGLGNLWVSMSNSLKTPPPIAKFDGKIWTSFTTPAVPFSLITTMISDPNGNLYVVDNSNQHTLYKYDGITWRKLTDMPFYVNLNLINMTADNKGDIWFTTNLLYPAKIVG